ncbi:MAG: NUDIX domain-containing protein, partial [Chloroflexota bacterium]
ARWWDVDALPENFSEVHHRRLDAWRAGKIPAFPVPERIVPIETSSNYIREIREKVGTLMLLCPGATMLIFNDAGEVLVQRRTDDSLWNFPGGAYEPGEEIAETAIREAHEETGLLIKPVRLVGVYGGEDYIHTYANGEMMAYINVVFVCEIIGGALQKDSESSALRFVQPDALPEPFTDKHRELIVHAMTQEADAPYFVQ